jgi:hypothetical protein
MDVATLSALGGIMAVMMTVMIYLDRRRGADLKRIEDRLDQLTAVVFDLVKTVGEMKGRLEALAPSEALSAAE